MKRDRLQGVGQFFDSMTDDYTESIVRCFPRYPEMLWAVIDYLPTDRSYKSILELGCGTGNLSVMIQQSFPDARLQVVDLAAQSLEICRGRLSDRCEWVCQEADFGDLDYPDKSFDLVLSSIAIHHLDSAGKQRLFGRVSNWLTEDGLFCFADQCAGATADVNQRHLANWRALSEQAGSSDQEWHMWMEHQRQHDHHDTLGNQMQWLTAAGFPTVDCTWRCLLWSVIQARKSASAALAGGQSERTALASASDANANLLK